jgi:hypothetical protein
VKNESIICTGFPLPKECIGGWDAPVLRKDLLQRLLRLDPENAWLSTYGGMVREKLKCGAIPSKRPGTWTLCFAVGGAGAQFEMVEEMLVRLKSSILKKRLKFVLSAGKNRSVNDRFVRHINLIGLGSALGNDVKVAYDPDIMKYFAMFNRMLRTTDVVWTKPSEMAFYSGLALPILTAPAIGEHEDYNKQWLMEMGAGVEQYGGMDTCDEWLDYLWRSGKFADAAWNGFLKAPRNGAYNIEKLVKTGRI